VTDNRIVLYIAMSLDGYIAREDGTFDWLFDVEGEGDNGYAEFYDTIGTVVMGRATYEDMMKELKEFPYAGKPCYVMSRTRIEPAPHVAFTDEDLRMLVPRLKAQSEGDVWLVGGGQLVEQFLAAGLLETMHIAIIPKVLGSGLPLFPQGTIPSTFRLTKVEQMNQIVMLTYAVPKP
jgi:dihydrofolate reductase